MLIKLASHARHIVLLKPEREMAWTTVLALIAFFQNNESTKQMLDSIDGLSEGMEMIMEYNYNENR